jgi:hypothetical protein
VDLTPKAFANFSPGLEQPWEQKKEAGLTPKVLANITTELANAFSVALNVFNIPRVVARSNPGLKLVNAFGVPRDTWLTRTPGLTLTSGRTNRFLQRAAGRDV